jgi:hypothetical protein
MTAKTELQSDIFQEYYNTDRNVSNTLGDVEKILAGKAQCTQGQTNAVTGRMPKAAGGIRRMMTTESLFPQLSPLSAGHLVAWNNLREKAVRKGVPLSDFNTYAPPRLK